MKTPFFALDNWVVGFLHVGCGCPVDELPSGKVIPDFDLFSLLLCVWFSLVDVGASFGCCNFFSFEVLTPKAGV